MDGVTAKTKATVEGVKKDARKRRKRKSERPSSRVMGYVRRGEARRSDREDARGSGALVLGFVLLACGTVVPGERNQTHNSWMATTQLSRGNGGKGKEA